MKCRVAKRVENFVLVFCVAPVDEFISASRMFVSKTNFVTEVELRDGERGRMFALKCIQTFTEKIVRFVSFMWYWSEVNLILCVSWYLMDMIKTLHFAVRLSSL